MFIKKLARWASIALVACYVTAAPSDAAIKRGVYLVEGTSDYYFVDDLGSRHIIKSPDTVRVKYFRDEPVITTKIDEIRDLPEGDVITEELGPDQVIKQKTVIKERTVETR